MVRTDSKAQKLDAFLQPSASSSSSAAQRKTEKTSSTSTAVQDSVELDDAELLTAADVEPCDGEDPQTDAQPPGDEAPPR